MCNKLSGIEYRRVMSQKSKFLKLWDLLRYSESTWRRMPTCQKSLSYCNYLGMRYWPFNAPVTPYKLTPCNFLLVLTSSLRYSISMTNLWSMECALPENINTHNGHLVILIPSGIFSKCSSSTQVTWEELVFFPKKLSYMWRIVTKWLAGYIPEPYGSQSINMQKQDDLRLIKSTKEAQSIKDSLY